MPSTNQSGGFTAMIVEMPLPALPPDQMSYWNWCTISCISTSSFSAYAPVSGKMFRCLRKSVKPPVPSPTSPGVALVCTKSECDAYTTIGFRSLNWWFRTRESCA